LSETISFFSNLPIWTDNIRLIFAILVLILPVASGFLAYLTAVQKIRKDIEAEFDKDLRRKRIEAYQYLWENLKVLTHTEIIDFHLVKSRELIILYINLHKWYFKSGMFMSISSRKHFDELKDNMRDFLGKQKLIYSSLEEVKVSKESEALDKCIKKMKVEDMKKTGKIEKIKEMIKIGKTFRNSTDPDNECIKRKKEIKEMIKIGKNFRDSLANDIGGRREFWRKGFRLK
jgi:hypothetical protein